MFQGAIQRTTTHSSGVENKARLAAASAHKGKGAVDVVGSLGVESNVGGACPSASQYHDKTKLIIPM